ncbi:MAG: hypothetical protein ABR574_03905 [Cryomorphaceae bacterium]|nr:hypothetical protein [Flavobacteriales bacterium]
MNLRLTNHFILCTFLFALFSCSNDDDNPGPSSGNGEINYPVTVTFQSIEDRELRIWTSTGEIDASNYTLEDFMDEDDFYFFTEEWYSSMEITFTEDSLTSMQNGAETVTNAYEIVSDSIFILFEGPIDPSFSRAFLGYGSAESFTASQGYYTYCSTGEFLTFCDDASFSNAISYDSLLVSAEGFPGYEALAPNTDTLVVYNHKMLFY